MPWLESTLYGSALVFGFRHGFDWDHIAALTDLTGSQATTRRSMFLATLYAVGHAVMVLALGILAILFAAQVPDALDTSMERVVGVSLVALGLWVGWTTIRTRGAVPPRSRWMLLIDAVRRGVARVRKERVVVIEHDHPHGHDRRHDHQHEHRHDDDRPAPSPDPAPVEGALATETTHRHLHRHVVPAPSDPFLAYGSWSAFGIGLLHGVGAETPTQVLVFAAAANASGTGSSIGVLVSFLVGLVVANTIVAAASTFGYRRFGANRMALGILGGMTAVFSLGLGALLLTGNGEVLPPILVP